MVAIQKASSRSKKRASLPVVRCLIAFVLVVTNVFLVLLLRFRGGAVADTAQASGIQPSRGGTKGRAIKGKLGAGGGGGGVYHTPETVLAGKLDQYISLPVLDDNVTYKDIQARVRRAMARKVNTPLGLMHKGNPPGHDVVMGLASFDPALQIFRILVGSLRQSGYDGHIILGVRPEIPKDEQEYLKKMDVTFYGLETFDCDESITDSTAEYSVVRGKCAKGVEYLTLEKARFALSRQWLHACKECTGWALTMDTRDLFFQAPPFIGMPPPDKSPYDLLFIEEATPYTQPDKPNKRPHITVLSDSVYQGSDEGCYGHHFHKKYPDRAVLCSGTVIGNRKGMDRFLAVFVDEFLENSVKNLTICRTGETPDQFVLQPLYYSGYFGEFERTRTSPWGTGPINTIGIPCADDRDRPNIVYGSMDLTEFDAATGLILNINLKDGDPARIAPVVHQFDRCSPWIDKFFEKYDEKLFGGINTPLDQVIPVPWLKGNHAKR